MMQRCFIGSPCCARHNQRPVVSSSAVPRQADNATSKRNLFLAIAAATLMTPEKAAAFEGFKKDLVPLRKRNKVDLALYSDGPEDLKYYDVKIGEGPDVTEGDRVVIHYEAKWRGITFMTSRMGMGVTGGEPYGFNVGAKLGGVALHGLDLGVRGMRKGGIRKLSLAPSLAYGDVGVGEIPGGATLDIDVELLSIKNSPNGYQVKIIEG